MARVRSASLRVGVQARGHDAVQGHAAVALGEALLVAGARPLAELDEERDELRAAIAADGRASSACSSPGALTPQQRREYVDRVNESLQPGKDPKKSKYIDPVTYVIVLNIGEANAY